MSSDPEPFVFRSHSELETDRLAEALTAVLAAGDVIALRGNLGAGKTRLVRGIARAVGADRGSVSSPTFGLVQLYEGDLPVVHIDAYRLSGEDEFERLGGPELFDPDGVTLIEWSERIEACLPRERWTIEALHVSELIRDYRIDPQFRDRARRLSDLAARMETG